MTELLTTSQLITLILQFLLLLVAAGLSLMMKYIWSVRNAQIAGVNKDIAEIMADRLAAATLFASTVAASNTVHATLGERMARVEAQHQGLVTDVLGLDRRLERIEGKLDQIISSRWGRPDLG